MNSTVPLLLSALALGALPVYADEFAPTGNLDVAHSFVRTGMHTNVSWNITYPTRVVDLVDPEPGGRVTTKEELRVKMRVAGVAFQSGRKKLKVSFSAKLNSAPWLQVFYGDSNQVNPDQYVFDQVVPAGTTLNFGAQGRRSDGSWYDPRWTSGSDITVTGLTNGDTPPSYAPAYEQGDIESFISNYISADNTVQLDPNEMIYLFELASRNPYDWWFDMQDIVVIVSYERTTTTSTPGPEIAQGNGRRFGRPRNSRDGWRRWTESNRRNEVRD